MLQEVETHDTTSVTSPSLLTFECFELYILACYACFDNLIVVIITDSPSIMVFNCRRPSFPSCSCACLEQTIINYGTAFRHVCTVHTSFLQCSRLKNSSYQPLLSRLIAVPIKWLLSSDTFIVFFIFTYLLTFFHQCYLDWALLLITNIRPHQLNRNVIKLQLRQRGTRPSVHHRLWLTKVTHSPNTDHVTWRFAGNGAFFSSVSDVVAIGDNRLLNHHKLGPRKAHCSMSI